ncbi:MULTISPECIES: hypothetical protein [unclassified Nonomuraea]|uniref:hypothetical protein n=1 Tax=unclassified Nonomuraea TaxID=2593643 RepID=UPI0033C7DB53
MTAAHDMEQAPQTTPSLDLLLDLLDVNEADSENCTACVAAHELWPRWPHGACPFHHGVNHGVTTTDNVNALDLLPSDDIDPTDPADVARLADITGQSIPDGLTPAQTVVAVFRAAQEEMTRRRTSHKPLFVEIGPETRRLMTQDTTEAMEAQRLCSDLYHHGWMVGVMPIDHTIPPNEVDHVEEGRV